MPPFEEHFFSAEDFSGTVGLFPLPNLVLFPHIMQPLHIFEPRYRDLLQDSLRGERLIGMALLTPGWEKDYEGRPAIEPVACLGRIATHHRLADGTYNVLLLGLQRVRLVRELEPRRRYRRAEVEPIDDSYSLDPVAAAALHRKLREAFLHALPMLPEAQEQIDQLLGDDVPLSLLADVIGYVLDVGISDKMALLAEADVHRRAERLLEHLAAMEQAAECPGELVFPPQFSTN